MPYGEEQQAILDNIQQLGREAGSIERTFDTIGSAIQESGDDVFFQDVVMAFDKGYQKGREFGMKDPVDPFLGEEEPNDEEGDEEE